MATYLVTGASRGLGFAFLDQLSQNSSNTVIGLVRNKAATVEKIQKELGTKSNVHIVEADITDYKALKATFPDVEKATGGKLDYLIANAGYIPQFSEYKAFGDMANDPEELEKDLIDSFKINVVGNVHLFNTFMPLVLKGHAKKVITLASGHADPDIINQYDIFNAAPYSVSKAAMNVTACKFSAQYKKDGVLFLSISPGVADTGNLMRDLDEDAMVVMQGMMAKFAEYAPDFKGPTTPDLAVKDVLKVVYEKSVANGDGGAFISQHGNKKWL